MLDLIALKRNGNTIKLLYAISLYCTAYCQNQVCLLNQSEVTTNGRDRPQITFRPRGHKTFFMLNSAEREIFSANKYENANISWYFHNN